MRHIVVITGMSGSGKSTAIRALEDLGYFCIDNLPAPLLMKVTELGVGQTRLAFVIDVREGEFLKDAPRVLDEARRAGHRVDVLFLDASDEVLNRRYSETRRRHPLSGSDGVTEGLQRERVALSDLRVQSEHILDTSVMTVHQLRQQVSARFSVQADSRMAISVMSFGFKYGVPSNADLVFDVRFLPNPFFVPELKALTGRDERVASYVLNRAEAQEFCDRLFDFLSFLMPRYQTEGKSYVTVAIGCTGGKHRSVALSEIIAKRLRETTWGTGAQVTHRDIERE